MVIVQERHLEANQQGSRAEARPRCMALRMMALLVGCQADDHAIAKRVGEEAQERHACESGDGWDEVEVESFHYTMTRSDLPLPWLVGSGGLIAGEPRISVRVHDEQYDARHVVLTAGRGFNAICIEFVIKARPGTPDGIVVLARVESLWDVSVNGVRSERLTILGGHTQVGGDDDKRVYFYLLCACRDPQSGPTTIPVPFVGMFALTTAAHDD